MTFNIYRIVGEDELLKRPRVSYKISEYIFEFIDDRILKLYNILQSDKFIYDWTLSFGFGIPKNHRIIYNSPYATDKRLYISHKGFRTFEKVTKNAHLSVIADDIDQDTEPIEYAYIVYNMFADYLLFNYKKLKKEMFDQAISDLDIAKINSFPFPAPYDEQKYFEWNKDLARQKYIIHYGQ